ncbi:chitinase [Vibrio fluvialis]|uniref:chitinase n=1 Tax=Vibrio fluvialis TaxID=676 RepID=UPI000CEB7692|nr:chitinase [Vibrio fluvialis]AVH31092.1 carbohydrate-binding protein [Vibrio fluvialis]EKO3406829.1 chitinase [Vibrio fluvialis]ELP2650620.1 chitinase [Vibrio fluvialis]EMC0406482.1 chitinase [Vibrio fluvialis]MCE7613026.1 chitinase [Vibrio fluvialis]
MLTPSKLTLIAGCLFTACGQASMTIEPDPNNPNGYLVSRVELNAAEQAKTANPMYAIWAKALQTQPNSVVEAIEPGLASNPGNVQRVERVFPQSEWDYLTHMAAPEYTYTRFLRAIGKFPAFCGDYTDGRDADAICKKSIVTAFAHFSQETGGHIAKDNVSDNPLALEEWQQALVHVREMGWSEGQEGYTTGCGQNDWQNARWPCAAGQGYFGRGAKQLSYHFNYGAFSEAMFDGDATVLLNNPGLVADSWLNLASAIWFFLTPQAPKPAMLHVIDRTWVPSQREIDAGIGYGFGTTINVINGGIECGEQNKDKGQPVNRIRYWEGLAEHYQIPQQPDEKNTCWQQTPYGSLNLNGATDVLYTNWDGNWKYYPDRPGGYSFECELVGFQTAYSALVEGDYEKCVTNFYGSHANWPQVRVVEKLEPSDPGTDPGSNVWDKNAVYNAGDQVVWNGATYEAKWWTQGYDPANGGPWLLVSGTQPTPEPTPEPAPAPDPQPTPDPVPETGSFLEWQPGVSQVANGDKVTYNGRCFIAKNGPGVWETPVQSNWFWDEISCQ